MSVLKAIKRLMFHIAGVSWIILSIKNSIYRALLGESKTWMGFVLVKGESAAFDCESSWPQPFCHRIYIRVIAQREKALT